MKIKNICSLIAAFLTAASAHGEVVVYKGFDRTTADINTQISYPKVIGEYLIVDYAAKEVAQVLFFTNTSGKHYAFGGPSASHLTSAPLPQGRTASIISTGFAVDTTPTNYSEQLTFLRGTNGSVTVSTAAGVVQRNVPRTFAGTGISTGAPGSLGNPGYFLLQTFGLSLDAKKTIEANNASRTLQQVLDDVLTGLKNVGYVPL